MVDLSDVTTVVRTLAIKSDLSFWVICGWSPPQFSLLVHFCKLCSHYQLIQTSISFHVNWQGAVWEVFVRIPMSCNWCEHTKIKAVNLLRASLCGEFHMWNWENLVALLCIPGMFYWHGLGPLVLSEASVVPNQYKVADLAGFLCLKMCCATASAVTTSQCGWKSKHFWADGLHRALPQSSIHSLRVNI